MHFHHDTDLGKIWHSQSTILDKLVLTYILGDVFFFEVVIASRKDSHRHISLGLIIMSYRNYLCELVNWSK